MGKDGERPPELLRADREQLDRAAELLRGDEPAFVIVVCAPELVPAARGHLSREGRVEIPEAVVLQGAEEALEALLGTLAEIAGAKVRSLALGGNKQEVLRGLNWHREKLLRGAPVVLWLNGVDALTEMREAAPDAYSFRDMVVLVRGDGGRLPQVPYKESRRILEARRRVARARTALERAHAYDGLSGALRAHGHLVQAESVAHRGLEALPEDRYKDENAQVGRAALWSQVAMAAHQRGSQVRRRQAVQHGMNAIGGSISERAQHARAWLLSVVPGPFVGRDRMSTEQACDLVDQFQSNVETRAQAYTTLAQVRRELGDMIEARRLLNRVELSSMSKEDASLGRINEGILELKAGRLSRVETYLGQTTSTTAGDHMYTAERAYTLSEYWIDRSELEIAERIIQESFPDFEPTYKTYRNRILAIVALTKGEEWRARESLGSHLRDAAQFALDEVHLNGCNLLTQIAIDCHGACRIDVGSLQKAFIDLEVAQDVSISLTGAEPPPWYAIRFLGFRADILIRTDRVADALDLAHRALDLARTTYPDLIPETGRALADHLLRAGKPDEALPILADVEPEAISRGMLKELALIRAARILALVLGNEPPAAIEPHLTLLRETLEATGAPRIKAETLLELAIRLPPATQVPDPLALATETHALFLEMPMPAKEARALEVAGDILAARGKPPEAKRRYLTAHGILERRGLGLRLPLVTSKIERLA